MIRPFNAWYWLAAALATLPQAGVAAEFWLTDRAALDGSSSQPLTAATVPRILHTTTEGGGSLYLWGKPDAGKTLESWSLSVVSMNAAAVRLISSDVVSFNPVIGRTLESSPMNIRRWEFPDNDYPNDSIGIVNQAGTISTLDRMQGFTLTNYSQVGVGIGPQGAGGLYSDPLTFNGAWLLAQIDYSLTGAEGPAEIFLRISQRGLKYLNQPQDKTEVRFGAVSDAMSNYPDHINKNFGTADAIIDVKAQHTNPPLPPASADFDADGDVDGGDFLTWQRGLGKERAWRRDGDANRDGVVNAGDLGTWQQQIANQPAPPNADFDGDSDVDGSDFLAWQRGVGKPDATRTDGDTNGDRAVDGVDLAFWRRQAPTGQSAEVLTKAVPEPATWALALAGSAFAIFSAGWRPGKVFRRELQLARKDCGLLALLLVMAALPSVGRAATLWYDHGGGGDWGNLDSWSTSSTGPNTPPPNTVLNNSNFLFNTLSRNGPYTVTLGSPRTANLIVFNSNASGGIEIRSGSGDNGLTINAGGIDVQSGAGIIDIQARARAGESTSWTNNSSNSIDSLIFNHVQTLGKTLTITGNGRTAIRGVFGDVTNVNKSGALIKDGTGTLDLENAANNHEGGTTIARGRLVVKADGSLGTGALTFGGVAGQSHVLELAGDFASGRLIQLNSNATIDTAGFSAALNGPLTGSGSLAIVGGGTVSLGQFANTYTGGTAIGAGTLAVFSGASMGGGPLYFTGGTLWTTQGIGHGGTVHLETQGSINTSGQTSEFTGQLVGGSGLTVYGGGTLRLKGPSSAVGQTHINAAAIEALPSSLPTGAVQIDNGRLGMTGSVDYARTFVLNGFGGYFDTGAHNPSITGQIQGTGRLFKTGSGLLTLHNSNLYFGGTQIDGGVISVGSNANLGSANSKVTLNGGTLRVTTNNLVIPRPIDVNGGAIDVSPGVFAIFAGNFNGTGGYTKSGSGTLALTGSNAGYTGTTTVSGGILQGSASSIPGNVLNNSSVILDEGGPATYSGIMSGSGALTKVGGGSLTLSNASNNYQGGTQITQGELVVGANAHLGAASGAIAFGGGGSGTLRFNADNFDTHRALLMNSSGTIHTNGHDAFFRGAISGGGRLTKTGNGTLSLYGSNSGLTGGITVDQGTLQGDTNGIVGQVTNNSVVSFVSPGTFSGSMSGSGQLLKFNAGTLTLAGTNTYSGGSTVNEGILKGVAGNAPGTGSLQGNIVNHASVVFDQAATGSYNHVMSGTGKLVKEGPGALNLYGVNSYGGGTEVNGGAIFFAEDRNFGTGGIVLNGGSIFATAPTIPANITLSKPITVNGGGNQVNSNQHNLTLSGNIGGLGALTKSGVGTLRLTGSNNYAGGTVVNQGTLVVNSGSLGPNNVDLAGAGTSLVFDQAEDGAYGHVIYGPGSVTKSGAGPLQFSGFADNTYSGGTVVEQGTLILNKLSGVSAVGDLTINASATARLNNHVQIRNDATITVNGGMLDLGNHHEDFRHLVLAGGTVAGISGSLLIPFTTTTGVGITSSGQSTINAPVLPWVNGVHVSDGTLTINGPVINDTRTTIGIIKTGEGTLNLTNTANDYAGGTTISQGKLIANSSTSLGTGGVTIAAGGTLGGTPTIGGNLVSDGRVAPGNSPGIITVNGNYTQTANSILDIEIAGYTAPPVGPVPGVQFDQVRVSGNATLGGTYNFPIIDGFVPQAGQEFPFLTASSITPGSRPTQAFAPGLETANPSLAFRVIPNANTGDVTLKFVDEDEIFFDETAGGNFSWFDETRWTDPTPTGPTDRVPEEIDITTVSNESSTPQHVTLNSVDPVTGLPIAEVNQLLVEDDNESVTVGVASGFTLSTRSGDVVIGNHGNIELSENAFLETPPTESVLVQRGGALSGDGDVIGSVIVGAVAAGDNLRPAAIISPGAADAHLSIQGAYTQSSNGEMVIDVNSTSATTIDAGSIDVSGAAALSGMLTIDVANDDAIVAGTEIVIMTAAGGLGSSRFEDAITVGSDDFTFVPQYRTASGVAASVGEFSASTADETVEVRLKAHPKGDMNLDLALTIEDARDMALAFVNPDRYFEIHDVEGTVLGRMDANGYFDFDDVTEFRRKLNISPRQMAMAFQWALGVPEPGGLSLAMAALCVIACRVRQRS